MISLRYVYDEDLQEVVYKTFNWLTVDEVTTPEGLAWVTEEMAKDGITNDMPMIVDKYVELANYKFKSSTPVVNTAS